MGFSIKDVRLLNCLKTNILYYFIFLIITKLIRNVFYIDNGAYFLETLYQMHISNKILFFIKSSSKLLPNPSHIH